jgi:polyisoprenoid-binding protein YceI
MKGIMKMRTQSVLALALLISSTAFAQDLNVTGGAVSFIAIGRPSAIKIHGKGPAPEGQLHVKGKEVTGSLSFDLNSLDTGIGLRNRHMKEKYLQTDKYPAAQFTITKMMLPSDWKLDGFKADQVPVEGKLTLHGQTQPVKGTADIRSNSGTAFGHVKFTTSIPDYKIDTPNYMGIKVADSVDVDVDVEAKPAAEPKSAKK